MIENQSLLTGISESWFMEWCEKHGYMWEMRTEVAYDDVKWPRFGVLVFDEDFNDLFYANGVTPSEARAKVVIAASAKENL